jgi:signal transduction histidine kinase/CheY-like chemotaxis protein/HPt (histidine-containing phosphotransfer) domain-containing protein
MKKLSLPVKVGFLMTLALLLVSAAGYLTFRSLSSIVNSIQVKTRSDLRLFTIREISTNLDKAQNSVRLYTFTRKQDDIKPYYEIIDGIDDKIDILRTASRNNNTLLTQIDTISSLIEENMLIWNKMLDLYHSDSLDIYIRKLTAKVAVSALNKKNADKSILKRVFGRKAEINAAQQEILSDLNKIEKQDSIQNTRLLATESQLAITGNEIRERFYILISRMEEEVTNAIKRNAKAADRLAFSTYRRLAVFAFLGTLLVALVLVVVVRYVRKTHEYQKALGKSKEETEKLASTKEMFMANMSHEIRTPVNAIFGFTEQLLYESHEEKTRNILEIIKSASDHLLQIVNDILDFSKLQNAKILLEATHFEIHTVCEEVQLLFEKKASQNHTRLFYSISNTTPPVLLGDSCRLKQILLNLVGNAVKFTVNGEIHFSVDCNLKSDSMFDLILKVSDTGIGIHEDMQARIFDDFTQAEVGTSRKYGGTGLGLSIVKKLVELHEGNIALESIKNRGTTITCSLPYALGNIVNLPAVSPVLFVPVTIRNLKLLVVDDEEYNRLLFKTILDKWNVSFDEAPDGLKAIDMIKTTHYDLVFMDVRMPGLDGHTSTRTIRNELGKSQIELPIIGISASHTAKDMQDYQSAGMNAFLSKPFTEKMLLEVILSAIKPVEERSKKVSGEEVAAAVFSNDQGSRVNLDNLYHLADHDILFVKEMLTRFIESTEKGLQEINQAVSVGNIEAALETAHKISAPCKHIGANVLYAHLKAIEEQARNHENLATLVKLSEDSNREFSAVKTILSAHLKKIND